MIFKKLKQKRERKIQEKNYAARFDRVLISNKVTHQNIGGKTGYVEREVTIDDILEMILGYNISAMNFAKRRPDLFRDFEDMNIPDDKLVKRKAKYKSMKYYYVKVLQSDDRNGTYLGYIIASDEYSEYIKAKDVKEEPIWI